MKEKEGGLIKDRIKMKIHDITVFGGKIRYKYDDVDLEVLDYCEPPSACDSVKGRWFKFWIHLNSPSKQVQHNPNLHEISIFYTIEQMKQLRDFLNENIPSEEKDDSVV